MACSLSKVCVFQSVLLVLCEHMKCLSLLWLKSNDLASVQSNRKPHFYTLNSIFFNNRFMELVLIVTPPPISFFCFWFSLYAFEEELSGNFCLEAELTVLHIFCNMEINPESLNIYIKIIRGNYQWKWLMEASSAIMAIMAII